VLDDGEHAVSALLQLVNQPLGIGIGMDRHRQVDVSGKAGLRPGGHCQSAKKCRRRSLLLQNREDLLERVLKEH
jgi:hypothetical protein